MSLDAASRRRYARQLLLGEVGEAGQERLLDARFRRGDGADATAFAVAADYLERAGCVLQTDGDPVALPDESAVLRFAGEHALLEPAAAIVGAFAAVEYIKATLGCGKSREFPSDLKLSGER